MDDVDDEDLRDAEVISLRPMLVCMGIDTDVVGQGSARPLWRRKVDGIGVRGEEVISLMDLKGKSRVRTPVQSSAACSHSMGEDDGELLPLVDDF